MLKSAIIAIAINLINMLISFIIIKYTLKNHQEKIFKYVFGSMVIRFFLIAAIIWFCLDILELEKLTFALTFLISTFVLIFAEILYLNYRTNLLNLQKRLTK